MQTWRSVMFLVLLLVFWIPVTMAGRVVGCAHPISLPWVLRSEQASLSRDTLHASLQFPSGEKKMYLVWSKKWKDYKACAWFHWTPSCEYLFLVALAPSAIINLSCEYNLLLSHVGPSSESENFKVVVRPPELNLCVPPTTLQPHSPCCHFCSLIRWHLIFVWNSYI